MKNAPKIAPKPDGQANNNALSCARKKKSPRAQAQPSNLDVSMKRKPNEPLKPYQPASAQPSALDNSVRRKPNDQARMIKVQNQPGASARSVKPVQKKKPSVRQNGPNGNFNKAPMPPSGPKAQEKTDNKAPSTDAMSRRQPVSQIYGPPAEVRSEYISPGGDPKSRRVNHSAEPSTDRPEREKEENSRGGGLSRIRDVSGRAVRKMKTFVSRPVKKATLEKAVAKVEARKEAEKTRPKSKPVAKLNPGEDCYVKAKPPRKQPSEKSKKKKSTDKAKRKHSTDKKKKEKAEDGQTKQPTSQEPSAPPNDMSTSEKSMTAIDSVATMPSGAAPCLSNKDNGGNILLPDGAPWWSTQRKPTDEELDEDGTEDDPPMDSEVLLEVNQGKKILVNMPNVPIELDAMNELMVLSNRDDLFFNRDILFGNTIRNMINLNDMSTRATAHRNTDKVAIEWGAEPTKARVYNRASNNISYEAPFKPTGGATVGDKPAAV